MRWALNIPKDPLARLSVLRDGRAEIATMVLAAVAEARERGDSWQSIGDALGMTRAGAWEQFHD